MAAFCGGGGAGFVVRVPVAPGACAGGAVACPADEVTPPATSSATSATAAPARPGAIAPDRAGVFASAGGDLELVAAEGRGVVVTGALVCEAIAALNATAVRLRSAVAALGARVSTLEAAGGDP